MRCRVGRFEEGPTIVEATFRYHAVLVVGRAAPLLTAAMLGMEVGRRECRDYDGVATRSVRFLGEQSAVHARERAVEGIVGRAPGIAAIRDGGVTPTGGGGVV